MPPLRAEKIGHHVTSLYVLRLRQKMLSMLLVGWTSGYPDISLAFILRAFHLRMSMGALWPMWSFARVIEAEESEVL